MSYFFGTLWLMTCLIAFGGLFLASDEEGCDCDPESLDYEDGGRL